jgi:hypothetical protein
VVFHGQANADSEYGGYAFDGYSKKRSYAYQYRGDEVDYFDDDEEEDDEDDVDVEWYRQELLSLYSQHNPSKVKDVDRLLEKFAG